ncbi:MAG: hypothetical protein FD167_1414, partial [bacterium]
HDQLLDPTDQDNYDQADLDHDDYDQDDQVDRDQNSYPLFTQRETSLPQNKQPQKSLRPNKKPSTRAINNIDLNIQSRFVRVPNWVADQLARQLSPAEEKIFDQIWRLTVGFNREVWRGKIADLLIRTGYSSRATVTKAIAGLSALGLIRIEGRDTNPRGRSYRIVDRVKTINDQQKADQKPATRKSFDQKLDHPS